MQVLHESPLNCWPLSPPTPWPSNRCAPSPRWATAAWGECCPWERICRDLGIDHRHGWICEAPYGW